MNMLLKRACSQKGNLPLAMTLLLVGLASALTLSLFAYQDVISAKMDAEEEQELFLLRSEMARGAKVITRLTGVWDNLYLPRKRYLIKTLLTTTTFTAKTLITRAEGSTSGADYFSNGYKVCSMIRANRGTLSQTVWNANSSMVKRYAETRVYPARFNSFMSFTDIEQTPNGTPSFYWGPDVIYGKVFSNSDIWIKQAGGGINNGWPTFHGEVYTAGRIQSYSGTPPYSSVFLAGYWEHVSPVVFNPTADVIRARGYAVGPSASNPDRIYFVTITGSTFSSLMGQIVNAGPDTADVWTSYPPRTGTYLFRNRWTTYDTIWTTGPSGSGNGHSNIVYSKLWLRGSVYGRQTWCSTDTLYLNDNLVYQNTQTGQSPDGTSIGSSLNLTDMLGIVSEKSVIIQYGYKNPWDSLRYKPNCDGNQQGIWIYGAICALANGNGNPHKDGVFTFEYQHPHSSTPAVRLAGSDYVWDKIDLHRHRYPQTLSNPWLTYLDYPWYNPLWPERAPYMERGTVHLYGAVAQRRSGYLHRNTADADYPNPMGLWNIPNDYCGGYAGTLVHDNILNIDIQPVNAFSTTGNGVGYTKDYHFDNRFNYAAPPDFPLVYQANGSMMVNSSGIAYSSPPAGF